MTFLKNILFVSCLLTAGTPARAELLPQCSSMDFKNQRNGTICETSLGGKFMKTLFNFRPAIRDLEENGKFWLYAMVDGVNQTQASKLCRGKGLLLPTVQDFELAESRGFREAFGNDMAHKLFWSSDNDPMHRANGYSFHGDSGKMRLDGANNAAAYNFVRCNVTKN